MADTTASAWPATVGENYNWLIPINPSNPPNLTGYTGDFQVRQTFGSAIILEASTSNGQMTLGGAAGTVNIAFPASLITIPGAFQYELKLTDPSGVVSKPVGGQFQINGTITP